VNSLEFNGIQKADDGNDWIVYFDISGTRLRALEGMNKFQKLNHFPGCWNLGRKDYMWKNLNKQRRSHP
jgi:tubulin polyglutamylase TTLL4